MAVQIVDVWGAPLLPPSSDDAAAALRDPELIATVRRAQRGQSPEIVSVGARVVACIRLRRAGADVGVLVLVRDVSESSSASEIGQRLEQVASVLRGAVEAHLVAETPETIDDARRPALRRTLAEAKPATELGLIAVFGEAMAIWEDLEVRAYNRALNGDYVQQWAPPSALDERVRTVVTIPTSWETREVMRLPVDSAEHLGITWPDIAAVRLSVNGSCWLVVFGGTFDSACLNRLGSYVDLLEQSMARVCEAAERRLFQRLWRHLVCADASAVGLAKSALDDLRRAVDGDSAGILVTQPPGVRAFAVGDVDHCSDLRRLEGARQLTVTRSVTEEGTMVIALARSEGAPPFSSRERMMVERAADLLESWVAAAVCRPALSRERRAATRPFQEVVEEIAAQSVRRGLTVAVVVIRLTGAGQRPGVAHRLASQIRPHLRAAEPAGALAEGEIAAVLFDANPEHTDAVIARLRRLADRLADGAPLASAAVGVAHCTSGSHLETPLIAIARQDALRREAAPVPNA